MGLENVDVDDKYYGLSFHWDNLIVDKGKPRKEIGKKEK